MWQKLSGYVQPLAAVAKVQSGPPALLTYIVHGEMLNIPEQFLGVYGVCLFFRLTSGCLGMKNREVSETKNYLLRLCFY